MKLILLSIAAVFATVSCNTTIGLGRDMRVLGTEMERKAEEQSGGGAAADDYAGGAPVY